MAGQSPKKPARRAVRQAQQARAKATVDAVVEAAARILAEAGWPAVNTNAIARRAGVSVGSVYEYFPNKQAILDVIIDRHLTEAEETLAAAASSLAGVTDTGVLVEALVAGFVRLHENDPRLHRALSSEVPVSPAQRARVEALRKRTISLLAAALAPNVSDPGIRATLLVDTADALAHRWLIDEVGLPLPADRMASEATKMLKGYLLS
ncbi:TetR/AcrR family transcriptional regulator [Parvularcula lutaonensis]|uniref:TetR/AcrR family transcriptional regulator n=1 Tax=Parvularcula lutaonensis TaxID=491923 RepID=UPI001675DD43|nr:TetR/AcrR family transcriptional regulator [Parvularcula lutaonensis]